VHPLVEQALSKPGALLIRWDADSYRDETHIGYQIGVQQPRQHFRFANLFSDGGNWSMYFKHDPAEIARLYLAEPERVAPSEIAGKHWSSVSLREGAPEAWVKALLDRSYELVLAKQSKAGRAALAEIANEPNAFSHFHEVALSLHRLERVYLMYSDIPETPQLSVDGRRVAYFSWNRIGVKPEREGDEWTELGVDRLLEWRDVLTAAVRRALDTTL
jgi:predicted DNA-binding protein (MmcQ/YjbR family)